MNRWEAWERSDTLRTRAIDLAEQAAKQRDAFRWWATAAAIAFGMVPVVLASDRSNLDTAAPWIVSLGLLLIAVGAGGNAWLIRGVAAKTYAEAREAFEAFWRVAS